MAVVPVYLSAASLSMSSRVAEVVDESADDVAAVGLVSFLLISLG